MAKETPTTIVPPTLAELELVKTTMAGLATRLRKWSKEKRRSGVLAPNSNVIIDRYSYTTPAAGRRGLFFDSLEEAVECSWREEIDFEMSRANAQTNDAAGTMFSMSVRVDDLESPPKFVLMAYYTPEPKLIRELPDLPAAVALLEERMERHLKLPPCYEWVRDRQQEGLLLVVLGPRGYRDQVPIQEGAIEECHSAAWDHYSEHLVNCGKLPKQYHVRYLVEHDWEFAYWLRSIKTAKTKSFGSLDEAIDAAWEDAERN